MSAIHVVVGWYCKGKDCDKFHALAYLGEKDKLEGHTFSFKEVGKARSIPCPQCRETHFYGPQDVRTLESDSPPPPGIRPAI